MGVGEEELERVEGEAVEAIFLAKEAVVFAFSVIDVTDDMEGEVLEVPSDLVEASGLWAGGDDGVAVLEDVQA